MTNLTVSCVVFWLSVPFTTYAAWHVKDVIPETSLDRDTGSGHESDEDPLL